MQRYLLTLILLLGLMISKAENRMQALETLNDLSTEDLYAKGEDYFYRNVPDSATLAFTIITTRENDHLTPLEIDLAVQARNYLGVINFNASNYTAAYRHFMRSVQIYDVPNGPGYNNLAALYLYFGDKPRAFQCLKKVTKYSIETDMSYHAAVGLINILMVDFNALEIPVDSVAPLIEKFRNIPNEKRDDKAYSVADILAQSYLDSNDGNHPDALKNLRSSLGNLGRMVLPARDIHSIYMMMAGEFRMMNQPDSAMTYLDKAESLAKQNDFKELLAETLLEKSDLYRIMGKYGDADAMRLRGYEIRDSLFNPRELGRLRDLQQAYETEHLQQDLESIRATDRYRRMIAWILGISLGVLLVFVVIMLRKNRELKRKTKALFIKNLPDNASTQINADERDDGSVGNDATEATGSDSETSDEYSDTEVSGIAPNIPEQTKRRILDGIATALSDEEIYTDPAFSLQTLSTICGSNTRYVSQVFNEKFGKTFPQILNERRIELAKRYFSSIGNSQNMTIEGVGQSVGFKSRTTFSKTFKAVTGLTPDEFKKMARHLHPGCREQIL
ncbi:MAG: AraC family transcriptional regulator [Muribaculaceae bacterium]|nr:AraC family transcriptional regulator [Muribaculaceae bacterium]